MLMSMRTVFAANPAGNELLQWTEVSCVDFTKQVLAALGSRPSRPVTLFRDGASLIGGNVLPWALYWRAALPKGELTVLPTPPAETLKVTRNALGKLQTCLPAPPSAAARGGGQGGGLGTFPSELPATLRVPAGRFGETPHSVAMGLAWLLITSAGVKSWKGVGTTSARRHQVMEKSWRRSVWRRQVFF